MDGFLDFIAQNPQILAGIFFFLVAGAVIRFVSGWLIRAGVVLLLLVLLGVVSSETAKGWALGTLDAGVDALVEAFEYVVLDEEPATDDGSEPGSGEAPGDGGGADPGEEPPG